jgi:hypothetical protein
MCVFTLRQRKTTTEGSQQRERDQLSEARDLMCVFTLRQRKTTTEGSQHREPDQFSEARVRPRQFHL